MEAGDYHDPVLLHLEEYSVGKTAHSRATTASVDRRKLQWMFRNCLNRQRETLAKLEANVVIPCPRFKQILI